MAVGEEATAAGYPLVPGTGEEGRVRWGAREINRTRDFIAQLRSRVWPVLLGGTGATTPIGARSNLGITHGSENPSGGSDGDIYFKIL